MKTEVILVDKVVDKSQTYTQAVDYLKKGEVVAFPTETVYGLGAIATDEQAVKKIFLAKGRPSDNPLIVHVGTIEEIKGYVEEIPSVALKCMNAFWPGPLTIVMRVKPNVFASNVTAGLQTVGVRMPNHPVALGLLRAVQQPLAAPSANRSGRPSPTKAVHVFDDLHTLIPCILDGGATMLGLESTVLDVTSKPPTILRPGSVTKEMLENVIGTVQLAQEGEHSATPKAPGMKYTHYAPKAPVVLISPNETKVYLAVQQLQSEGHCVALLAPENLRTIHVDYYFTYGESGTIEEVSTKLYGLLRACDETEATIILATAVPTEGIGTAIMNRLEKAAGGNWFNQLKEHS